MLIGCCWTRGNDSRRIGPKYSFIGQLLGVTFEKTLAERKVSSHQIVDGKTSTPLLSICNLFK